MYYNIFSKNGLLWYIKGTSLYGCVCIFFPWVSFNFGQLCMALLHKNTDRCALIFKTSDPTKLFLTLFYFA